MEDDQDVKNLKLAWTQILGQYKEKAESDAKKYGHGMSVFVMKKELDEGFNCNYFYISYKTQTWDKYTNFCPNKELLEELYDPERMFLMSVHVPTEQDPDETVGNIRLFEFDSYKEIVLEK